MVQLQELVFKIFDLYRADGILVAHNLELLPDGRVSTAGSLGEIYWGITGNNLAFVDAAQNIKISFPSTLHTVNGLLFLGVPSNPAENGTTYVLTENNGIRQTTDQLAKVLDHQFYHLRQTVNLISRRDQRTHPIRSLFLVHNIEAWDSLMDIYLAMRESSDFEPTVATLPRCFPGDRTFTNEAINHEGLEHLGIPHLRFAMQDSWEALDIMKAIAPDVIFRQTPWENDIPPAFRTSQIAFSRLCYVPYYGFNLLERYTAHDQGDIDFYGDQLLHRMCWRIYCETELTRQQMASKSSRKASNVIVSGHPKLDRLWKMREKPEWPIQQAERKFRLIWSPHHSIGDHWLGFGTFLSTYRDMIDWARRDDFIEIVMKPHPALFSALLAQNPRALQEFVSEWSSLKNTHIVQGGDYGPLFAASDAMLTDGISFLAEYQIFDKPLLFLDSCRHAPFNSLGTAVLEGAHRCINIEEAEHYLKVLRKGMPDLKTDERRKVIKFLMPSPGKCVDSILRDIREGIKPYDS